MTITSRALASFCLLGLLTTSTLHAATIIIRVTQISPLFGGTVKIYVNGKLVGSVNNSGQENTFHCDNAQIGVNEVHAIHSDLFGTTDLGKKKFIVRQPNESIEIVAGLINSSKLLKTSTEVGPAKIDRVELDRTLKGVILKESPPIRLAPNTEHVVEDSLTLRHEIKTSTTWKVGADLKAEVKIVWASISAGIRGELERVISTSFSVETKRTRSVTIKGGNPVKVVWMEYFRTGTAIVDMDGRKVRVPFEVDEDFDLVTEPAE